MKKITLSAIALLISISAISTLVAANDKVAVLYNGNSKTNKEALSFLGKEFRRIGTKYKLKAVSKGDKIKAGEYKAIIVLNTGQKNGVDPVLQSFISSWGNKKEIILLNLQRGSRDYSVKTQSSASASLGVDTITAASAWEDGLPKDVFEEQVLVMHRDWADKLVAILDKL